MARRARWVRPYLLFVVAVCVLLFFLLRRGPQPPAPIDPPPFDPAGYDSPGARPTERPPGVDGACAKELAALTVGHVWARVNYSSFTLWMACATPVPVGSQCWGLLYGNRTDPRDLIDFAAKWAAWRGGKAPDDPMFLDVGAHGGLYTLWAARLGYTVLSIDPVATMRGLLALSLCANGDTVSSRVRIATMGLSDRHRSCSPTETHRCYGSSTLGRLSLPPSEPNVVLRPYDDAARDHEMPFHVVRIDAGLFTHDTLVGARKSLRAVTKMSLFLERVPRAIVLNVVTELWADNYGVHSFRDRATSVSTPLHSTGRVKTMLERMDPATDGVDLFAYKKELLEYDLVDHVAHLRAAAEGLS